MQGKGRGGGLLLTQASGRNWQTRRYGMMRNRTGRRGRLEQRKGRNARIREEGGEKTWREKICKKKKKKKKNPNRQTGNQRQSLRYEHSRECFTPVKRSRAQLYLGRCPKEGKFAQRQKWGWLGRKVATLRFNTPLTPDNSRKNSLGGGAGRSGVNGMGRIQGERGTFPLAGGGLRRDSFSKGKGGGDG